MARDYDGHRDDHRWRRMRERMWLDRVHHRRDAELRAYWHMANQYEVVQAEAQSNAQVSSAILAGAIAIGVGLAVLGAGISVQKKQVT